MERLADASLQATSTVDFESMYRGVGCVCRMRASCRNSRMGMRRETTGECNGDGAGLQRAPLKTFSFSVQKHFEVWVSMLI